VIQRHLGVFNTKETLTQPIAVQYLACKVLRLRLSGIDRASALPDDVAVPARLRCHKCDAGRPRGIRPGGPIQTETRREHAEIIAAASAIAAGPIEGPVKHSHRADEHGPDCIDQPDPFSKDLYPLGISGNVIL
jgi:hypothetical protein